MNKVNRKFRVPGPNILWLSDFTYIVTWRGVIDVAFVIDASACRIFDRRASQTAHEGFVLDALEQAVHDRRLVEGAGLVHNSDHGSQYLSIRYTERLGEPDIELSVSSVGDSYEFQQVRAAHSNDPWDHMNAQNALAETINGLFKAEAIHRRGLWRNL